MLLLFSLFLYPRILFVFFVYFRHRQPPLPESYYRYTLLRCAFRAIGLFVIFFLFFSAVSSWAETEPTDRSPARPPARTVDAVVAPVQRPRLCVYSGFTYKNYDGNNNNKNNNRKKEGKRGTIGTPELK